MTLRGTPFVFEGQEIGMTNGDFQSLDEVEDIESHNIYAMAKSLGIPERIRWKMIQRTSRDNARTPMQWSDSAGAGFTKGTPWLKINENYKTVNVESENARTDGVLAFWKRMIGMRRTDRVLSHGDFRVLYEGKRIYAFERSLDGRRLISVSNLSGKTVKLPKSLLHGEKQIVSSYSKTDAVCLMPFEFRLYESEDLQ